MGTLGKDSFLSGSAGKEITCNAGDLGLIPGLGRSPGEGNSYPLWYSCLENSMGRGAWQGTVHGTTKSQTRLSDWACTHTHPKHRRNSYIHTQYQKPPNNPIKKWVEELNRHFLKGRHTNDQQEYENMLIITINREMQITLIIRLLTHT